MIDLSSFNGLSLKLFGDGNSYLINIHTKAFFGGFNLYQMRFTSVPNIWKIYSFPFKMFKPLRQSSNPLPNRLETDRISTLSINFASDGSEERDFLLNIKWIKAISSSQMK